MNTMSVRAEVPVQITKRTLDHILFEALNAGGVSAWADKAIAVGGKLGKKVCEQVSYGGEIRIHEIDGAWFALSMSNLLTGIKKYIEESCHVRIEDGQLALEDLTANDADVIIQFAVFGEVKY